MRPLTLLGRQATFLYVVCIAHLGQVSLSIAFLGKKKKIQKTSHYGGTERRYAYKSDPSRAYSSSLPLFWSHIDTLVLSIKAPGEPKFYTILPYVIASWFIVPCLTLKSSWPGGRCIHTLPSSTGLCP